MDSNENQTQLRHMDYKQLSSKIEINNVNDTDRCEEKSVWYPYQLSRGRKNSTLLSKVPDGSRSTPIDPELIVAGPLE